MINERFLGAPHTWEVASSLILLRVVQGLGFPSLSNLKTVPVFFNMIDNGDLDAPTFGLYLNPNPTAEPAGEIIFGGVNQTYYAGDLFEVPVVVKSCAGLPAARMRTL